MFVGNASTKSFHSLALLLVSAVFVFKRNPLSYAVTFFLVVVSVASFLQSCVSGGTSEGWEWEVDGVAFPSPKSATFPPPHNDL